MTNRLSGLVLTGQNSLKVSPANVLAARPGRCLCVSAEDFETCQRLLNAFERLAEAARPQPRPMVATRVLQVSSHDRARGYR
jgi:hypothetical protein